MDDNYALFRDATIMSASTALVIGLSFISKPLLARLLGPDGYGTFALLLGTAVFIQAAVLSFIQNGFDYHAPRNVRKINSLFYSEALGTLALFLLAAAPAYFLLQPASGLTPLQFGFAFASAAAIALFNLCLFYYRAKQDFKRMALLNSAFALTGFAVVLAAAFATGDGTTVFLCRAFATAGIALLVIAFAIPRARASLAWIKKFVSFSLPLVIPGVVIPLSSIVDRYSLASLASVAAAGVYDISYSLATVALTFSSALTTVLAPKISANRDKAPVFLSKTSLVLTLVLCACSIAMFYYSDLVSNLVLGPGYASSNEILRLISLAVPIMGLSGVCVTTLVMTKNPRLAALVTTVQVVLFAALNWALVPTYQGTGAALALLLSNIVITTILIWHLEKTVHKGIFLQSGKNYVVFLVACAPFLLAPQLFGFALKTCVILAFYAFLYQTNKTTARELARNAFRILAACRARIKL
ncbi:MAG: polysaccharide biosynthesis C-terminal domain-containing protein [Candidatus Micrarchaeia archaeon]